MSTTEKIVSGYKQSLMYWLATIGYSIIAGILIILGIFLLLEIPILGTLILLGGIFLALIAGIAGLMFGYSRGKQRKPIGFIDGYKLAFKLILELISIILIALGLSLLAFIMFFYISPILGIMFYIIAGINNLLLGGVIIFYTIDFLQDNIK